MASTSEIGHSKNVTNFETLILNCTGFGAGYIPSNTDLRNNRAKIQRSKVGNKQS